MNYDENVLVPRFLHPLKNFTLGLHNERRLSLSGGYRPVYFGWNIHRTACITVVYTDDMRHRQPEWGTLHLRVPNSPWAIWNLDDATLRRQLLDGGALDAGTIRRRFEAREFDPMLFSCLAIEWFSELRNESSSRAAPTAACHPP